MKPDTSSDPQTGLAVLKAFLAERSPLGPLRVMAERVGHFFQVPLPGFKPYIVYGPDAMRKVLITERDKFLWRNHDPVTDLLDRGLLVTDGEEHDRYRKLMEPSLHPGQLPQHAEMMREQARRVSAGWQDGQTVDMLIEGRKIALLIILQALFSRDAWDDLPRIWTPILKAIDYISPGAWILWRNIPRPGYKKHLKTLDDYLYEIIAERRKAILDIRYSNTESSKVEYSNTRSSNKDLLQHLIDANLPDKIIRDQMLTMLIAGHDTSTALLAWVFALLGQHPEVHARLVRDLEESEAGQNPPLLDQVIKETLRLYPPIHIGNRMVAEDVTFGEGETIPAGSRMFYSIYLTQRDPAIWENPDQFQPERFARGRTPLGSTGQATPPTLAPPATVRAASTPVRDGRAGVSYIPFGGGPRACIGAAFGQAEARIILTYMLQNFDFQPLNPHEIHPHMGATLEPRPGVLMKIRRRSRGDKNNFSSSAHTGLDTG